MSYVIVTPVYNDWQSFGALLHDINAIAPQLDKSLQVLVVNDGSSQQPDWERLEALAAIESLEIVHLIRNLGHQQAIAIGLVALRDQPALDAIIVMDADGEDRPTAIPQLIAAHQTTPDAIVVAQRHRRTESPIFRLFYILYKMLFGLMTGQRIDYGNFALIPASRLDDLTYNPNLWNHLAATVNRARIPLVKLQINRGQRYAGESQMDFQNLVLHGLSAISVYLDVIAIRVLILFTLFGIVAFVGILLVLGILWFTDLAIPGWATSAVGLLTVIVFQTLIFSAGAVIVILSRRSHVLITPALDTPKLIKKREVIFQHES